MDERFRTLAARLPRSLSMREMEAALTHHSWYGPDKEHGNSKYILAGHYAFKGEVARLLIKYYPAHGAKLEHVLGNLFKDKYLDRLWDDFGLGTVVRHGASSRGEELKHAFVYAFLGCLTLHLPADELRDFIRTTLLANVEHLFAEPRDQDYRARTDALARQLFGCVTTLTMAQTADGGWRGTLHLAGKELAEGESRSRKYAMKKVYKEREFWGVLGSSGDSLLNSRGENRKIGTLPNGASLRMNVSKTGTVPARGLSQAFAAQPTRIP